MASFSFDTSTVAPRENTYELLPAGNYTAQVTESEIVSLKSGNGQALKLTFEVLSEGYRGRKIWARLNVQHSNSKAEQIAQQQLRELCEAIGIVRLTDTTELHRKPVSVRVKIRKDESGQYDDQNDIAGFKSVGATSTVGFPSQPAANAPAAAAASSTPPWAKKTA